MTKLFDLKLEGFEGVLKTFNKLPDRLQKKALRPALRAGTKIIQKAAKALAPTKSGKHKKFMKIKSLKRSRDTIGMLLQTGTREQLGIPRDEFGYYPMVLEYGSKNQKKQPSMKPALERNRSKATNEIGRELGKQLNKILPFPGVKK